MPETTNQPPATELITFEFQHTDERGNPIMDPATGKQAFTNLTGKSWQEIAEKQRESYLNLARAAVRWRSHKPVPKEPEPQPKQLSVEEERQAAVDLQDPTKARAAVRKLTGVEDIETRQSELEKERSTAAQMKAAYQFMSSHLNDYYPCQANSAVMSKYINDEKLDPRVVDNYEIAFNAVGHLLAPRPTPVQATPPANEPPALPPVRQSNGGIQPGELSGTRPTKRPKNEVTKDSINEMRRTEAGRAEYKKRMRDPAFVAAVNAAFQT